MTGYRLTPLAEENIFSIWTQIYRDNPGAADTIEEALYRTFDLLAQMPGAGHVRPDLTKRPVRFWNVTGFPSYLVVYRSDEGLIRILRVLHGARNLREILG